ncbi:MAG: hypothetical protein A3J24_07925, partial [Deltaproteobacteria bacterium RIFCSPLOWO2_02_FULL_53_8]
MSRLIYDFQKDHLVIMDGLNAVKRHGVGTKECMDGLKSVKEQLLAHLRKEDLELYPVLRKVADKDAHIKETLELFAKDMDEISKAAMAFFTKYASGGEGTAFARDFGSLYTTMQGRIR